MAAPETESPPEGPSEVTGRAAPVIESIPNFRRYQQSVTTYSIPETRQNRKLTDVVYLITFAVCIVVFVPFLIYAAIKSDLTRLLNGYDKCGNICGATNDKVSGIPCSGQDETNFPFLKYIYVEDFPIVYPYEIENKKLVPDKCVKSCPPSYIERFNRCYPPETALFAITSIFSDVTNVIHRRSDHLIGLCFIGLGFAIAVLLIFRFFTKFAIWLILIATIVVFIALPSYLWYAYANYEEYSDLHLSLGIFFSIGCFVGVIFVLYLMTRVNEILCMFRETLKIIFTIPLILLEPLLTFIFIGVIVALFFYFLMVTWSCGNLKKVDTDLYDYVPDIAMALAIYLNAVLAYWMLQFVYACQHMVVSGAVSSVYFTKDNLAMASPIYDSFYNLVRFHLGTTAYGSFIITLIQILKVMVKALLESDFAVIMVCLTPIQNLVKYISSLAYVVTAIHGQPFCNSSRRGITLVVSNFLTAIVVNTVGDAVLYMSQLLVVSLTVCVGLLMNDGTDQYWIIIVLGAFYTFLFAYSFFVAFQVSLQTVFLCFCEDQYLNDGMERPYSTSLDFLQHIEKAQKIEEKRLELLEKKKNEKKKGCC